MNRDYRIVAKKHNFVIDKVRGDDLANFPIERARLRSIWYMIAIAIAAVAGYGWALQARTVRMVREFMVYRRITDYSPTACCCSAGYAILDRDSYHRHIQYMWNPSSRLASCLSVSRQRIVESCSVFALRYGSCSASNHHQSHRYRVVFHIVCWCWCDNGTFLTGSAKIGNEMAKE